MSDVGIEDVGAMTRTGQQTLVNLGGAITAADVLQNQASANLGSLNPVGRDRADLVRLQRSDGE